MSSHAKYFCIGLFLLSLNINAFGWRAISFIKATITLTNILTNIGSISAPGGMGSNAITSDGKAIYSSPGSATVYIYNRNTSTGLLSLNTTITAAGVINGITTSPNGNFVYVMSQPGSLNKIQAYTRNTSNNTLSLYATYTFGNSATAPLSSIAMSPDGLFLYAAASGDNGIYGFSANTTTGDLSPTAQTVLNVTNADVSPMAISSDGKSLYYTDQSSNLEMISRNLSTGALTDLGSVSIGSGAFDVIVSPDGKNVYANNYSSNLIYMFSRNTTTGSLTGLSPATFASGTSNGQIAITADGLAIYGAAGTTMYMIKRNATTGLLSFPITSTISTANSYNTLISPDGMFVYSMPWSSSSITEYLRH